MAIRDLSLAQLQTFMDVIELGGFSAAAERLGLSQPAVSLQVRQLERRLGVALVERVGKRATPTAAGARLLDHARLVRAAVDGAIDSVTPYAAGAAGRVRLGVGSTACIYLLPDVLRRLRRRFPGLEIVVRTGNTSDVLKDIEANDLDLGLVTLPAPGRMFDVTPLLEDAFVLIAPAAAAPPRDLSPAGLAAATLVLYEAGGHTRRVIDEWFERGQANLRPAMELGSVEAIKELVGAGLGLAIVPAMAIRDARREAPIAAFPLDPPLSRTLALVLRRDKVLSPGLRAMLDELRAAALRWPGAAPRPRADQR